MNVVEEQQWAAAEARPTSRQASRASCASCGSYASYASAVRMQSTVPRRRTQGDSSGAVVQWCSDAAGVLDANRPAGQLGRRSSALGRFGSFTRHPLLVPNGIAARRPCHRDPCPRPDTPVDTTFPSLSARMYCGPPPSSPRRFSGLVVPGPPSLKYALHLGGITSQVDPAHGMLHK